MSKKLFVVDTLVTYRMKYVIEAKELDHAFDEITMRDSGNDDDFFDELSQLCLGEQVIDGRPITEDEFKEMIKSLSTDKKEMCSYWMGDKLIRKINYDKKD